MLTDDRNSPITALTTLYPIFESPWRMVLMPYLKHALYFNLKMPTNLVLKLVNLEKDN